MATRKTYTGITRATFEGMRAAAIKDHGTVYTPPAADQCTATTIKLGQKVVLAIDFDEAAGTVSYEIKEKGFLVPENAIWKGIEESIRDCGG